MLKRRPGRKLKPWMALFGLFGFLGMLGFILKEPSAFQFFVFFGFFSFYWWSKVDYGIEDERLIENQLKAFSISSRTAGIIIFASMLLGARLASRNLESSFSLLLIFCSMSIVLGFNLHGYLIYYYESKSI